MRIFSIFSGIKSSRTLVSKALLNQKEIGLAQINLLKKILVLINLVLNIKEGTPIMWKQGNGTLISIKDMTTDHINASLNMMRRTRNLMWNGDEYQFFHWEHAFMSELYRRRNSP